TPSPCTPRGPGGVPPCAALRLTPAVYDLVPAALTYTIPLHPQGTAAVMSQSPIRSTFWRDY
ncbi:MAG: hypothetical protein IKH11_00265, partial [Bacteroidales bacterium]|nr:hypothetical protein [Bacteroidales bacterium]